MLHSSLTVLITAVNKIKDNSLNDRLFRELCKENDEEFQRLIFHTEVRWLSKGYCLRRFSSLFETVTEFLRTVDSDLYDKVYQRKIDIAYLTDFFDKINEVQTKLQGTEVTLVESKSLISSFLAKLLLFAQNLARKELCNFPRLRGLELADEDNMCFCNHLKEVHSNMKERFTDLLELKVPEWFYAHLTLISHVWIQISRKF